ncbi:MAG: tripartite tricarboxylate transporter substrate binding protein [Pseudomonadota bacterium]
MKAFNAVLRMVTVGVLMAIAGSVGAQQAYPNKPIRFIVPYPPGGSATPLVRFVAQKLTDSWGQTVITDNRGGGNTIIASELLVKSPPDGYTILLAGPTHVVNPSLITTSYDAFRDFAPIATLVSSQIILVINPSVPVNNLQELIALAKSRPGQLNYASASSGGINHLAGELFNMMTGVKTLHIPYKGGAQAVTDLIGGQVQLYFSTAFVLPQVKSGRIKAIAVSGTKRMSALPQVPTFAEAGLPSFSANSWYGVLAPAGTPKQIIDKLAAEFARIQAMSDTKEFLDKQGVEPFISGPEQFAALMKEEMLKWRKVIKAAHIKID